MISVCISSSDSHDSITTLDDDSMGSEVDGSDNDRKNSSKSLDLFEELDDSDGIQHSDDNMRIPNK